MATPLKIADLFGGTYTVTVSMPPRYKDGPVTWLEYSGKPLDSDVRGVLIQTADGKIHFCPWSGLAEVRYPG